ncbi:hypothetical protein I6A84_23340 [Frankia sp. CNm7]|nr:hypothetical protein [Frankia nepalensis]MBL7511521.1 hypothetical protein [Frankia nepalensis]MBL7520941.1 hypothetical protein [Frankia nepalensis]
MVTVDESFDRFRGRFERAVPPVDFARFEGLVREGVDWDEVRHATAENAPHSFMIYWRMDVSPLFRLAGGTRRCVEYLMGNHVIAERMYRHDPAALLYAPLRLAIYDSTPGGRPAGTSSKNGAGPLPARTDAAGGAAASAPRPTTSLTIDQPSSRFAGLGDPNITQVGLELDRKLAELLGYLDAPVPEEIAANVGSDGAPPE